MSPGARILVVDDQPSFLLLLQRELSRLGYTILPASSAREGLGLLAEGDVDLVLSDLVMPGIDGLAFLALARESGLRCPFVFLTGHATIATAMEAVRQGAFDYVEKTASPDERRIAIERALSFHRVEQENVAFRQQLQREHSFLNIVTVTPAMRTALELAASVARTPRTTVALLGESGCGKEILARAIHVASGGGPGNFVGINCAAIPITLLESELFGHVRGAFTGAERDREGRIARARGGTLLLDEIGDLPLELQAKLLRVMETREYERVGGSQTLPVECRIIVATHRDLERLVEEGRFRTDLYHRVLVFPITLPPLRNRREDIPLLVQRFMTELQDHLGKPLPGISREAMQRLFDHDWPGNIRELRNCLERAAILVADGELIRAEHLALGAPTAEPNPGSVEPVAGGIEYHLRFPPGEVSLEAITQRVLAQTLLHCDGNKSKAAALLKINRKAFYR